MASEKAPLPFGYTFMAGERIPRESRNQHRNLGQLTMVAKQAPLPVFLKHVPQFVTMRSN
jgi:hypothetical protein